MPLKRWIYPAYSRSRVRKAGQYLSSQPFHEDDVEQSVLRWLDAHIVMSNWRAAHAYPMHATLMSLRRKAAEIDKNSIVVQRLKREASIRKKLLRFGSMRLDRMQDLGGCRAIVKDQALARQLMDVMNSRRTKDKLHKVFDYIEEPKESGYRGLHAIYKYYGDKTEFHGLSVEVQYRSLIQHAWATAVEIVDAFKSEELKIGRGSKDWEHYFKLVSAEFAYLEGVDSRTEIVKRKALKELAECQEKLNALDFLKACAVTVAAVEKRKLSNRLLVLEIDWKTKKIRFHAFQPMSIEESTKKYDELEERRAKGEAIDAVLIRAESATKLRKAYPNYFADSRVFVKTLEKVFGQDVT
jgi:ppGpp synthetase/RelA/SpoT-type nucleotidyltranferase